MKNLATDLGIDIDEIAEHENEHWSQIFKNEKSRAGDELYSSYWWEDYYSQITSAIKLRIPPQSTIAEIGSGSGKATLLLGNDYEKHLFDISPPALDFAKYLAKKLKAKKVTYILGNGFDTKLKSKTYDFTWNIGVIEHYDEAQAVTFVAEMMRITKRKGQVAVAVPNFNSFHIKKAQFLAKPIMKWSKGYKLDSENSYPARALETVVMAAGKKSGRNVSAIEMHRFGNPLPMGTPKYLMKSVGKVTNKTLSNNRFLLVAFVTIN